MHPSELKNQALVAASKAESNGFSATAEAFKLIAFACAEEARTLLLSLPIDVRPSVSYSTKSQLHLLEAVD